MTKKYYVTMTDKFMSNWGHAKGKTNKLIFICNTLEEAEIVEQNAQNRTDMKHINICTKKPYYNSNKYLTQIKTKEEYPNWYKKGYFNKQN